MKNEYPIYEIIKDIKEKKKLIHNSVVDIF